MRTALSCCAACLLSFGNMIAFGQSPQLIAPTDALTPEQQQKKFHLPPGFEIQLIVADDAIGQPMNLNFDAAGRLWITSSVTYPYPVEGEGVEPRDERFGPAEPPPARDWVTVVEGIGADGKPERVLKFAEGLNIPIGIVPVKDGTIVYDIPAIRLHQDTDGDGKADEAKRLLWGFGNVDTHGMNNGFTRWIDGWIYACHGFRNTSNIEGIDGRTLKLNSGNTYRFHADGTGIERFTWGQVNPFGLTFDPLGNLYSADCHSMPLTLLLKGAHYPSFGKPHDGLGFGPKMIDHSHGSTGICGPTFYAAEQFPEDYRNNLFLCNPVTGRVHRDKLIDHGSTRLVDTQPDFITSDDPWFRPVDVQVGPDGCLYVSDFYNAIIGHYEVELKHPKRDRHLGRVWRVVYRGEDGSVETPPMPDLTKLTLEELTARLGDGNLVVRTLATNELIDRFGEEAAPAVTAMLSSDPSPEQKTHGLWVLERLGQLATDQLVESAKDDSRLVRTHAARIVAERPHWPDDEQLVSVLKSLAKDQDAFVQRAAVDALGRQPEPDAIPFLLTILNETPAEDTHLRHTVRLAFRNQLSSESANLSALLASASPADLRELMSVSLAVKTEPIAMFLAGAMQRSDDPPSELMAYAQHVARVGTAKDIQQAMKALSDRLHDDPPRQQKLLLMVLDGLEQRGAMPNDFVVNEAVKQARTLLNSADHRSINWRTLSQTGTSTADESWVVQQRRCQDGDDAAFFSTLPRGEQRTGIYRSSQFRLPEQLRFFIAGHCGVPGQERHEKNQVRLIDGETGLTLASAVAPRNDTAQEVVWNLDEYAGRPVSLELVDGDAGNAYAWLAVGRFSKDDLNPARFSPLDAAVELIGRYQLNELMPDLTQLLEDESADRIQRTAAARALVSLDPDARLQALIPFASDPRIRESLQNDILAAVNSRDGEQIDKALAAVTQSLPASQQEGFAMALASDREGGEALLQMIERGKASRQLLLADALKQQLTAARLKDVESRLSELTAGLPSRDEQVASRIVQHRDSFDIQSASAEQGRAVFEKVCAACHRIGDKGELVGPQLDGVGIRGVDRLLEDLLDPNRNVDGAFRTSTVLTTDGQVLTGLFRREEGETLVFADQKGKEFTVQAADIEQQSKSSVSLMPTNLYELVQPDQIDDLLAYLLEQRAPLAKTSE